MAQISGTLRSKARQYTDTALRVLVDAMTDDEAPHAARVTAAGMVLDRGWGKAAQPLTGEDGEGEITIVIRRLMDEDAMKTVSSTAGRVVKTIDQVVNTPDERKDD